MGIFHLAFLIFMFLNVFSRVHLCCLGSPWPQDVLNWIENAFNLLKKCSFSFRSCTVRLILTRTSAKLVPGSVLCSWCYPTTPTTLVHRCWKEEKVMRQDVRPSPGAEEMLLFLLFFGQVFLIKMIVKNWSTLKR